MKNYKIILKDGSNTKMEAENEDELFQKIDSGHFGILPIRGTSRKLITRNNIDSVEEDLDDN